MKSVIVSGNEKEFAGKSNDISLWRINLENIPNCAKVLVKVKVDEAIIYENEHIVCKNSRDKRSTFCYAK